MTVADPTISAAEAVIDSGIVLSLQGIGKSFPGVRALDEVSFEVRAGEVHALVGENGAGKSTLMAIASGALAADEGRVLIGGQELDGADPSSARRLGLAIVRQDPALLPDLTVAENMAIGVGYAAAGGLAAAPQWAATQLAPWQMGIDPRTRVDQLSMEQRFVVEIAKALALEPSILILDEPTEHLNAEESERLFRRVRSVVEGRAGVVYISHRIPEVKSIADRVTVLRDGRVRGTFEADGISADDIVALVIGRSLDVVFPPKRAAGDADAAPVLRVEGLSSDGFSDVSLAVQAGEIVGIAGVQGNGQAELIAALAGMSAARGTIEVGGRRLATGHPARARDAGVAYIPADRHGQGILATASVRENIVIGTLRKLARLFVVSGRRSTAVAQGRIESLGIKTPSWRTPIGSLSGGNQQKAVFARALEGDPRVIIAEEPSQGVDAGARVEIYRILREAAAQGACVVVLSSDGVELEGLCDRVLILSRGQVVRELAGEAVTEQAITGAALTSTAVRSRTAETGGRGLALRRWARGDSSPAAVLALAIVVLAVVVAIRNPAYLSAANFSGVLLMLVPVIFIGLGQAVVVMGGGFDLSVGPLCGFLVVAASFWMVDDGGPLRIAIGLGIMLAAAVLVGLVNAVLIQVFGVNPIVATLAMFMVLRGLSLTLRPTPDGLFDSGVVETLETAIGFVPIALVIAVALAIGLQIALRRSRWGVELRAIGSNAAAAARLGIRVGRVRFFSYLLCAILVVPAALLLMAQIGIGDPNSGVDYTLISITAVVLGGASIFGGRGSFIGVVLGAAVIQQLINVTTFLRLDQSWQYWLLALLTLGAAITYATLRRRAGAPTRGDA